MKKVVLGLCKEVRSIPGKLTFISQDDMDRFKLSIFDYVNIKIKSYIKGNY